jgi:hypothetical protein
MIYTGTYKTIVFKPVWLGITTFYTAASTPELAYTDVVSVKVEGDTFDIISTGLPSGTECLFVKFGGILIFDRNLGKDKNVFVIYQR